MRLPGYLSVLFGYDLPGPEAIKNMRAGIFKVSAVIPAYHSKWRMVWSQSQPDVLSRYRKSEAGVESGSKIQRVL
jgi:hypothetical protein